MHGGKPEMMTSRLRVGDFKVLRVHEIELALRSTLLPDWRPGRAPMNSAGLAPDFYDLENDLFKLSIHSWLLRRGALRILIDTCAGNQKYRPAFKLLHELDTPWLSRLGQAGVLPEQVDFVVCTHFHVDHVGWNTRFVDHRWVPTFPNARYIFPRLEREALDPAFGIARAGSSEHAIYLDSILPVIEAGQAVFVEGGESLTPGVDLMPVPGHSKGQIAVRVRSRGDEAMFVGDVVHHPLQIDHPEWNSSRCEDPVMARDTRLRVLHHCARNASLLAPAHFARPHCGKVERDSSGFRFLPTEFME